MSSIANTVFGNNIKGSNDINIPGFKASSNRVSLSTQNTDRLWVDSQGKVGIGTSNPSQLLHLFQDDSNEVQLKITNSDTTNGVLIGLTADEDFQIKQRDSGKIKFYTNDIQCAEFDSSGNFQLFNDLGISGTLTADTSTNNIFNATDDITFSINDTELMRIETGGNIGIGTSNPSELLHLNNSSGSCQIRMLSSGSTNGGLFSVDSGGDYLFRMRDNKNMKFQTNDTERMRIDGSGNVGIGTADPTTIANTKLFIHNSASNQNYISFKNQANGTSKIGLNNGSNFILYSDNDMIFLTNSGTEQMRITTEGYVGIGTGNPTHALEVSTDDAVKPTTSLWTIASDENLKENIESADLKRCFDDIQQIDLKRFKWNDAMIQKYNITDIHNLGFISQEIQQIIPKSVIEDSEGYLLLNKDQLIMSLVGCVKRIQQILTDIIPVSLTEIDPGEYEVKLKEFQH